MSSNAFNQRQRVACIVPTYNGREDLERLLDSLDEQSVLFDLFMVDSSSSDGTEELARSRVANFVTIPGSQFNHGGTRQMIVDQNPGYDIYVFMTQDAYLEDSDAIARLVAPFVDGKVGAVCGRQLPHLDASPLAEHARTFNYPATSSVKAFEDASVFGIKTPFISNSFSAYRGKALLEVGGFPEHVILSEDMYVSAKMLLAGWKIAYASDAICRHSHNYSLKEEFCRYFDQGVFHAREAWIRQSFGGAGGEGLRYVKSELGFLGVARIHSWPAAMLRNALKLFAYKLGQRERTMPVKLKKKLSMHKRYWDSPYAEKY
ncbi:glycosyltransferase [Aquipseudomonas alcaligenes]|uniref:Rhamnosyltransferase n=1 Tax=Aquipseudomonas alcaligenes TaxID=43263 RepID=A0AA37FLJ1_AQUAC|nr:glycosyltransferase family 2 protein [Pseudomonas alcaligenes]BCR24078.1 rhamnosyltransferase [Pseudomonas alcaligenes]GIZ66488.1 rhamnosyltransferase [Pseudomonas alcaligenes]GIZ71092.1 rhamnosyltransferase [Pseudomonas alcaligenes]GIZ75672.1 rhamnosyltransferase [Pseudomonas alcaligenes]GIZ79733.1 rhamnosyltransferase [Pseudomonas alcaligenes]